MLWESQFDPVQFLEMLFIPQQGMEDLASTCEKEETLGLREMRTG